MSTYSYFLEEDADIVTLKAGDDDVGVSGWVNVGVHSLRIELDSNGNLYVEAFARTNEGRPTARFRVEKGTAVELGGIDSDEGDDE